MQKAYVYIITNKINGKTYIGKSNGDYKYYYTGGLAVKRAIKKYGKENFQKDIIVQGAFNDSLLNELERHYIRLLSDPCTKTSYNITSGGNGIKGMKHTEETKKLISECSKIASGRSCHREKIGSIKYWQGKKRDENTIAAVRKANSRAVDQYSLNNEFIKTWSSMTKAAKFYKLRSSSGINCAASPNCRKKTAAGFIWKQTVKDKKPMNYE